MKINEIGSNSNSPTAISKAVAAASNKELPLQQHHQAIQEQKKRILRASRRPLAELQNIKRLQHATIQAAIQQNEQSAAASAEEIKETRSKQNDPACSRASEGS